MQYGQFRISLSALFFEDLAFNSDLAALLTNSEYVTQSLQTIVKTTGVSVAAAFGGLINIILFLLLTFPLLG